LKYTYLDCLALFGVGGAHPGGLKLTKHLLENEKINSDFKILDIGCGTGQTAAYLSANYHCHVTAFDNNKIMLEKAEKRFKSMNLPVEVVEGSAEQLPFPDNYFDLILSESVISFTNQSLTLSELNRVLKPEGVLLATEMTLNKKVNEKELEPFIQFYGVPGLSSEDEWKDLFEQTGFMTNHILRDIAQADDEDVENATEFDLSIEITDECFNVLEMHEKLTMEYSDIVGFRTFRSNKK
jgi:ubiquinone/menaquinone biosynthesis C-methylase UbiE